MCLRCLTRNDCQFLTCHVLLSESDDEVPEETLIQKYQLLDLCSEAAKLKSLGCMESIPSDRIIRLLGILEKNIRSGIKVSPIADEVSFSVIDR